VDYKQRIIEEASVMFRTYGIKAVTMDMLATNMGISKRTIYEVFKDKDELLKGVIRWMSQKQKELMTTILDESDNVIEAVYKMLDMMSDHFQKMAPTFQLDMKKFQKKLLENPDDYHDLPYYSNNSEILRRGIVEGVFREDIDIEITNKCLLEVAKMSNDQDVFPPEDFLKKDIIKNFYVNYLRGISTSKGLELIESYERNRQK
jgi:AcrR family transcriptional regulator